MKSRRGKKQEEVEVRERERERQLVACDRDLSAGTIKRLGRHWPEGPLGPCGGRVVTMGVGSRDWPGGVVEGMYLSARSAAPASTGCKQAPPGPLLFCPLFFLGCFDCSCDGDIF